MECNICMTEWGTKQPCCTIHVCQGCVYELIKHDTTKCPQCKRPWSPPINWAIWLVLYINGKWSTTWCSAKNTIMDKYELFCQFSKEAIDERYFY